MSQGKRRGASFTDDNDRERFLSNSTKNLRENRLGSARLFGWAIIAPACYALGLRPGFS
jgi:hypothetical protein